MIDGYPRGENGPIYSQEGLPCISGASIAKLKEPMRIAMNTLMTIPGDAWPSLIRVVPKLKARKGNALKGCNGLKWLSHQERTNYK